MVPPSAIIRRAETAAAIAAARTLMIEYRDSISTPLTFQGFDAEMAALPGKYTSPRGVILLGYLDHAATLPSGVIAFRELDANPHRPICEMKRLYVNPAARRVGMGRLLCNELITIARAANYAAMRLDTDEYMLPAQSLYKSLGFKSISKYNDDPIPNTLFYELIL